MATGRIAVFASDYGLSTNPTINAIFSRFAELQWTVDFFGRENPRAQFPEFEFAVNHRAFPDFSQIYLNSLRQNLRNIRSSIVASRRLKRRLDSDYAFVIGVDDRGVVAARKAAESCQCPLVYLSFEQTFMDELSTRTEQNLKRHEIAASRTADIVVVQDPLRGTLLQKENQLDSSRIYELPVAPRSSRPRSPTANYREKLGIHTDRTLVIHSGSFAEWTCAEELISELPSLNSSDIAVLIHTRWNPATHGNKYLDKLKKLNLSNVFLSTNPLCESEYEHLVASADIGLVTYQSCPVVGKNVGNMGLSSGKFSYYLKHGLPVVSVGQPVYADLFDRFSAGKVVEKWSDLGDAVQGLAGSLKHYRKNARSLFESVLSFDERWPVIEQAIMSLVEN